MKPPCARRVALSLILGIACARDSPSGAPEELLHDPPSTEQEAYKFGYDVQDPFEGHQFRHEEKDGQGNVQGWFGYRDARGQYRQVEYVADGFGFRANVRTNEAGTANENPADVDVQASPAIPGAPHRTKSDPVGRKDEPVSIAAEDGPRRGEIRQDFEEQLTRESVFKNQRLPESRMFLSEKPITFLNHLRPRAVEKKPKFASPIILENTDIDDGRKEAKVLPSTYQYVLGSQVELPRTVIKGHNRHWGRHRIENPHLVISGDTHAGLGTPDLMLEDPVTDDLGFYEIYKKSVGSKPLKGHQISKVLLPKKTGLKFLPDSFREEEMDGELLEDPRKEEVNIEISDNLDSKNHFESRPEKQKIVFHGRHGGYKKASVTETLKTFPGQIYLNLRQRAPGYKEDVVILEPHYEEEKKFYLFEDSAKPKTRSRSKKYPSYAKPEYVPHGSFGSKLNLQELPFQKAVLEINSDKYSRLLQGKSAKQRVVAIPVVLGQERATKSSIIRPQGVLHVALGGSVPRRHREKPTDVVPPMILHVIHEKGSFEDFGKGRANEEVDRHHTLHELTHFPPRDALLKKRKDGKDHPTTKWIPVTPLWNKIRGSAAAERKGSTVLSADEHLLLKCGGRHSSKRAAKFIEHKAKEPLATKTTASEDCS